MKKLLAFAFILASCVLATSVLSQTVYKTVENGVTTYSDSPPQTGAAEVLTIDVAPPAEDGVLEERLAQMRESTDRMAGDRREREKHRAELRELQQTAATPVSSAAQPTGVVTTNWGSSYWPGSGRPIRLRPPFRPGLPSRPQPSPKPLPQPYSVPGWSVMQPGNSQLMRPIVSSRR